MSSTPDRRKSVGRDLPGPAPSPYLVGARYDWLLFLGPPIAALAVGFLVSNSTLANAEFDFHGFEVTVAGVLLGILIQAHLVAVFFRSHGNPQIFRSHPNRFVLVPLALYASIIASHWILIAVTVTATFWDVYHSGMQTFGFGRIYDRKLGNDPLLGRRLDWALNVLLYAGPIVGGATMMDHFEDFNGFSDVDDVFFTKIPALMDGIHGTLTVVVLAAGSLFVLTYIGAYWRFWKQGYRVSWLKVWLYASTGITSIYAWGKALTLFLFLGLTGAYGYWVEALDTDWRSLWAITLVVSIMHFWYDGFIWSVRRNEV
jgi:hypothetical protein